LFLFWLYVLLFSPFFVFLSFVFVSTDIENQQGID
jgi:hypothetical protein